MRCCVIGILVALVACSSAEIEGRDGGVDAGPEAGATLDASADASACSLAAPYSTLDQDCNDCASAACCVEVNACLLDPDCNDGYVNCAIACALDFDGGADADAGPTECLADCGSQYPKGKVEYDGAIGCVDAACSVECQ